MLEIKPTVKLGALFFVALSVVGCVKSNERSVVSATSNHKPYVHSTSVDPRLEREYVSALEAAQQEIPEGGEGEYALSYEGHKAKPPVSDEDMEAAFTQAIAQSNLGEFHGVVGKSDASATLGDDSLWGRPPAFLGDGVTIMNEQIRSRFNDALATTPVKGKVEWRYGKHQFIFMPNSPIYQPFYSGGNCRDGVFIHYDGEKNERTRGLFCQKGLGADWYVQK